jgi:hypothetical protein
MSKPISEKEILRIRDMNIPDVAKALWFQNRSVFTEDITKKTQFKTQSEKQSEKQPKERRIKPKPTTQQPKFAFGVQQQMPPQMPVQMQPQMQPQMPQQMPVQMPVQMPPQMPVQMHEHMQFQQPPAYITSDGLILSTIANGQWVFLNQRNKWSILTPNFGIIFTTPEGFVSFQKANGQCVCLYRY